VQVPLRQNEGSQTLPVQPRLKQSDLVVHASAETWCAVRMAVNTLMKAERFMVFMALRRGWVGILVYVPLRNLWPFLYVFFPTQGSIPERHIECTARSGHGC
jgi:hypothetical protein